MSIEWGKTYHPEDVSGIDCPTSWGSRVAFSKCGRFVISKEYTGYVWWNLYVESEYDEFRTYNGKSWKEHGCHETLWLAKEAAEELSKNKESKWKT